jgi:ABC-type Mn2+/Zn2+ transport system permease subunit
MAYMTVRRWAEWSGAAAIGVLTAWLGGFLLSSSNSRCVDGLESNACSGAFASSIWHGLGVGLVIVGLIVVVVAFGFAGHTRRKARLAEQ